MTPQIKKYTVLVRALGDIAFFLDIDALSQDDVILAIESTRNASKLKYAYSGYFVVDILAVFENTGCATIFQRSNIGGIQFPGDIRTYLVGYVRIHEFETLANLIVALEKSKSGKPYIEATRIGNKIVRRKLTDAEIISKIDEVEIVLSSITNEIRDSLISWRQPPELADEWRSSWSEYMTRLRKKEISEPVDED